MIDTSMNWFWCLIIDFDKIEEATGLFSLGLGEKLFPDFWKNQEAMATYWVKSKNVKTLKCNLKLLDLIDSDDRHLYELILMSNYWF